MFIILTGDSSYDTRDDERYKQNQALVPSVAVVIDTDPV